MKLANELISNKATVSEFQKIEKGPFKDVRDECEKGSMVGEHSQSFPYS